MPLVHSTDDCRTRPSSCQALVQQQLASALNSDGDDEQVAVWGEGQHLGMPVTWRLRWRPDGTVPLGELVPTNCHARPFDQ